MASGYRYFVFYKPYGYLSQFTDEGGHPGLARLGLFPPQVYPLGRLDHDSEGLLLLTDNPAINKKLLNPRYRHRRTYWVQVEGSIHPEALEQLQRGVDIRINKQTHRTQPAQAQVLNPPPPLPERDPPIRYRASIPTSWLALTLTEGKNRQVRRMTAAVGFPTLRLVRFSMEGLQLDKLAVGEARELPETEFLAKLGLNTTQPNGQADYKPKKSRRTGPRR